MFGSAPKDVFLGIIGLIIAFGYITAATGDIVLITKVREILLTIKTIILLLFFNFFFFLQVHGIYRNTGASMTKAQQEFTSNFMRNEHVQNATANIAASAVRSQVNNMTQQQPRY